MIYSASRRTDLVAFYPDFIVEKVRRSRKLEAIVFWTKDPRNLVTHPDLRAVLADYPAIVQFTLTGLGGTDWEPRVPPPYTLADTLAQLADILPRGAVLWRFDPILLTADLQDRFDAARALLTTALGPLTEVTVSFVDAYRKVIRRLAAEGRALPQSAPHEQREIVRRLVDRSGLHIRACCEPALVGVPHVLPARCVDGERFDRLYGTSFGRLPKDAAQREACGCVLSTDIGAYTQACAHGCRYCYAQPEDPGGRNPQAPP